MAGSVNKVILVGNLGQDPEVRSFDNGGEVVNMSIATSETWKDRATGERRERTEWHRVAIFNPGLVTVAKNYLKKKAPRSISRASWKPANGVTRTATIAIRPKS